MVYSVFRPELGQYDYYGVDPHPSDAGAPIPTHAKTARLLKSRNGLGVAAGDVAWTVPKGARYLGRGAQARGRIARLPSGGVLSALGADEASLASSPWGLTIGIALVSWWFFKRPKIRRRR